MRARHHAHALQRASTSSTLRKDWDTLVPMPTHPPIHRARPSTPNRRKLYQQRRGTRTQQGYSNRWLRYSKARLRANPFCVRCVREGHPSFASVTDHIKPHAGEQDPLFWDQTNHQSLCQHHHNRKTATEDSVFAMPKPTPPHPIRITERLFAVVDQCDAELVRPYTWRLLQKRSGTKYARANIDGRTVLMHRLLLGLAHGDIRQTDHKNGDGLDNRRANLRLATNSTNQANTPARPNASGYRGVSIVDCGYKADIEVNGVRRYLGWFKSAEAAASAYNRAALEAFGPFARLNSIDPSS